MPDRVTLKDIAERARVGVATVDRVLNARAPVSEATAARVLHAAEALGYHAQALMRRRIEERAPEKTFGIILQKQGKWFYRSLASEIRAAVKGLPSVRGTAVIEYVESLSPEAIALAIRTMRQRADAIAVVSLDHATVSAAVDECAEAGVPVVALLSQLNAQKISGYVGIDSRKAGRTAGWFMARLAESRGEVGILIGSHRYRTQEDREVGFRSYLREKAPGMRLRDSVVYLDDAAVAYEAAAEVLNASTELRGLYHCGGGVEGVIQAMTEAKRQHDVIFICHEKSPAATQGLLDGTVDLVIANPLEEIAESLAATLVKVVSPSDGATLGLLDGTVPFSLVTSENI